MKQALFKISTKTVVTISIGAALYGITGLVGIPIGPNTQLRPSVIILTVFAVYFGPIVGFLAGFTGHMLTDMLAGWGIWWNWELSSGIFGFCAGLVNLFRGFDIKYGIYKGWHILFLAITGIMGFLLGYSFSGATDILLMGEAPVKIIFQVAVVSITNSCVFLFGALPIVVGFLVTNSKNSNLVVE